MVSVMDNLYCTACQTLLFEILLFHNVKNFDNCKM